MRKLSTLIRRYVWLISTIHDAGRISYKEIEEKWMRSSLNDQQIPFPLRTFHDHINAIQEVFDVNIVCDRSYGYKYYIENAEDLELNAVTRWMLNNFSVSNALSGQRHPGQDFYRRRPLCPALADDYLRPLAVSRLLRLITGLFKRRNAPKKTLSVLCETLREALVCIRPGAGRSQNEGVCAGQDYGIESDR